MRDILEQITRSFPIVKKDMRIFYLKGPVVIMGLLFPFFLFAAFLIGRNLSGGELFTGLIAMTAFFTSTAVGPTIIPWEARSKTFERLISAPVSISTVLFGDMQASFYFGAIISSVIALFAALFLGDIYEYTCIHRGIGSCIAVLLFHDNPHVLISSDGCSCG